MFERFTDRARQVVVLAQEEARALQHDYIGTEHILLGLIHEGNGVAARALTALGIDHEAVRQRVIGITGRGAKAPAGHIPFTPRAKKVLQLALREALQFGHNYIGTEHILLGLIREGDGVAAQVLTAMGCDHGRVRREVTELLGQQPGGPGPLAEIDPPGKAGRGTRKALTRVISRLEAIEVRLSALEKRVGTGPDLHDLDEQISQVREDKEAAINAQDFERAAQIRDRELELTTERTARRDDWASAHLDLPSLSDEVERLRQLLRQHGIDPQDGVA
jgi:ATP-dependent Clp protease ATP-binding subunit ClpC